MKKHTLYPLVHFGTFQNSPRQRGPLKKPGFNDKNRLFGFTNFYVMPIKKVGVSFYDLENLTTGPFPGSLFSFKHLLSYAEFWGESGICLCVASV